MRQSEKQPVGVVIGDFHPPHRGHEELWKFGASQVEQLIILLYSQPEDEIPGELRAAWVREMVSRFPQAFLVDHFEDTEAALPRGKEESSRDISKVWAEFLLERYKDSPPNVIFSSEPYGDYLAEYMGIEHRMFDYDRLSVPISARNIRKSPLKNWEYIPEAVRPYFVKVVTVSGTDGSSSYRLCRYLAEKYQTMSFPATDTISEQETVLQYGKKFGNKVIFCQGDTWQQSDLAIDLEQQSYKEAEEAVERFLRI